MSSNAPAGTKVNTTGTTMMGKCDSAMPGVCIADPKGLVEAYHVVDDKIQVNICTKRMQQLVLAGQWVPQPADLP